MAEFTYNRLDLVVNHFPLLGQIAKKFGKRITFFDLETTTFLNQPDFGITEIGWIHIGEDGVPNPGSSLINPGHNIRPEVVVITGITDDMVKDADPWDKEMMHVVQKWAKENILIGFNSHTFDVPALRSQLKRYRPDLVFPEVEHRDIRNFWRHISGKAKGKLVDVGEKYQAIETGAHRALSDVWTSIQILEGMLREHGLEFFDHPSGSMDGNKKVESAFLKEKGKSATEQTTSTEEIVKQAIKGKKWVGLGSLSAETKISQFDLGWMLGDFVEEGIIESSLVEYRSAQKYFGEEIPKIIDTVWIDENRGKTKPLIEALKNRPSYADYFQLRLYLIREGHYAAVEK